MKKVNFTLGLMLTMLLLGANFSQAAIELPYDYRSVHNFDIGFTVNVKANPHFNSVNFSWEDINFDPKASYSSSPFCSFLSNIKDKDTTIYKDASGAYNDGFAYNAFELVRKNQTRLSLDLVVKLNYTGGNDLLPVIKRTMIVGEWYLSVDTIAGVEIIENKLRPSNITIINYLQYTDLTFHPIMDRKNGEATFTYSQNALEEILHQPIYSVTYDISLHDEIGNPGSEIYEPVVGVLPQNIIGLDFEVAKGISTSIPTLSTVFVHTLKDFTFTVYSAEDIVVTSNRVSKYSNEPDYGMVVKKNGNDTYTVTIRQAQSMSKVFIKTKTGTTSGDGDGSTGITEIKDNAVWAANGTIFANAANPGILSIYSVTGQLIKTEAISGSYSVSMTKGLYIVKLNGKAYKVIL